ncbi:MAG TPA: SLC13 family permease [Gammaproteobacteria bacterium]|nr:SLC13 family permease [Gammaproteobacteria bacterium]
MPPLPDFHTLFVLLATVFALYLFTRDRLPLEASGLAVLTLLVVVFEVFPYDPAGDALSTRQLLAGFGNEALITVCLLMIIGKGMETTGALQPLAIWLARAWTEKPRLASLATMVLSAILSAFVNNTPVVVMLLPMLIGVAVRNKLAPSSILMPVGFSTILGGMATTIGSSTNLLVVSIAEQQGLPAFSMFSFSFPVLVVGAVGILYLWLIVPRLLPVRQTPMSDTSPRVYNAVFHVNDDSLCCGMTFAECLSLTDKRMRVDRIQRGKGLFVTKLPSVILQAGDQLAVRDTPERLKEFEQQIGATLHDEFGATGLHRIGDVLADQEHLAEIVVTRGAMLHLSTLTATRFAQRTGLLPLALHRARSADNEEITSHIGLVPLRAGDIILVQGTQKKLEELKRSGNALVLDGTMDLPRTNRSDRAFMIMALVVLLAATGIFPISVSALLGVGAMLATRCLTVKDAVSALSIPVIIIIVTSLALGVALTETQGAVFIARSFVAVVETLPAPVVLSCLMLGMAVLTNVVSNNAAGVIGAPIAIQVALEIGVPPEPFVLAVIFGANMSFATPFGYQTNLLVLTAGGYKFADFVRAGVPLTLLMWLGFSILFPVLYDLSP